MRTGRVRPDIIIELPQRKAVAMEVETSSSLGFERYQRVKALVDENYADGVLIVSTNPAGALSARRMSYRVAKGEAFAQRFLYTDDDAQSVLTTGRLVAFAAAEFDDFPEDEDMRSDIRHILSGNIAAETVRMSGLIESLAELS